MRLTKQNRQTPEVPIEGQEHAPVGARQFQDVVVSRILSPVSDPLDVKPTSAQGLQTRIDTQVSARSFRAMPSLFRETKRVIVGQGTARD
jgi:hypothetical protein